MMKRQIKKLILVLSLVLFLVGCSGFEYQGEYPELYSVALGSVLGQRGHEVVGGPRLQPPSLIVLERDRHGRVMFIYTEGHDRHISNDNQLIIQKVEGGYAYFYPHYNFISRRLGRGDFTNEQIETLRETNSWNQPMSDTSEFERVRISNHRQSGPVSDDLLIEVYNEIFSNNITTRSHVLLYLRTDNYGRSVYFVNAFAEGCRPQKFIRNIKSATFSCEIRKIRESDKD